MSFLKGLRCKSVSVFMGSVWRGSGLEKAWVREDFYVLTLINELEQ
jgi:hypothetical protein